MTREERKFAATLALFARMEEKAHAPKSAPSTPLPKDLDSKVHFRGMDQFAPPLPSPGLGTTTPTPKVPRGPKERYVPSLTLVNEQSPMGVSVFQLCQSNRFDRFNE